MVFVQKKSSTSTFNQLITILFIFAEIVIFLRLILKLLNASEQSSFIHWFYGFSLYLVQPFLNAFPSTSIEGKGYLELSSIFAALMYGLIAFLLIFLIRSLEHKS